MSDKSIDEQIKEKRDTLASIHAGLSLYLSMKHPKSKLAKVTELQDRLEYRTKQYEAQLLDEKIAIFTEARDLLKDK